MGICTITASKEEQHARAVELAENFAPNAEHLAQALDQASDLCKVLQSKMTTRKDVTQKLALLRSLLSESRVLCRGHSRVLKPLNITTLLTTGYNHCDSLLSAIGTLTRAKAVTETNELVETVFNLTLAAHTLNNNNKVLIGLVPASKANLEKLKAGFNKKAEPDSESEQDYEGAALPDAPDKAAPDFSLFKQFVKQMPKLKSKELAMHLTLPVMVTFNRLAFTSELVAKGFTATSLEGYTIMHDTSILAVNTTVCEDQNYDKQKVISSCLARISKSVGQQMRLVTTVPVRFHTGGWDYYWYGTESYLDCLGGRSADSKLVVLEWGLPFK